MKMTKEQMNDNLRKTINEILVETSKVVDKKLKDPQTNSETLLTLTRALETGLVTAQRFDFITGKCGAILFQETERSLTRTVTNITDIIMAVLVNDDINADDLMRFIRMLDLTSMAWKRIYSFGEDNPYC